eukprot:g9440.t2
MPGGYFSTPGAVHPLLEGHEPGGNSRAANFFATKFLGLKERFSKDLDDMDEDYAEKRVEDNLSYDWRKLFMKLGPLHPKVSWRVTRGQDTKTPLVKNFRQVFKRSPTTWFYRMCGPFCMFMFRFRDPHAYPKLAAEDWRAVRNWSARSSMDCKSCNE